ncbi:MAG: NYN domain-containing protein [Actinobacteria bacterium]|nr:MAG: NYN domain-containing protein [Actinomycetota bacterium]
MEEERIGLFIDYENLAIGAREDLGTTLDFKPIADALAERGRVVVRRAYADWTSFEADRRMLTDNHIELIEIPQRRGMVRKNAADIKMAVDAIELAFEREYVTTFVVCTGDSDFTPLVTKLRELDKRVIGVGLKASTSALLPPACDEFLFYENLDGVDLPVKERRKPARPEEPEAEPPQELAALDVLITGTLAGLQRSAGGEVRSSNLKRALIRKDPTFTEADYGFRTFGELLRHLGERKVVELTDEGTVGDPVVTFPAEGRGEDPAFVVLHDVVRALAKGGKGVPLSGLKNEVRKRQAGFSEKRLGYSSFLQFVKAAAAHGSVDYEWDEKAGDYLITVP